MLAASAPHAHAALGYPQFGLTVAWCLAGLVHWTVQARRIGPRKPVAPQWVTISEAARRLGVSTKTIRRRILDGTLAAHKAQGPGGFVYRVTDPAVLVVDTSLPVQVDRGGQRTAAPGAQVGQVVLELANKLAAAEVRAARAEWERDRLRAELAALPPNGGGPAPVERRWWWPFPVRWGRRYW